MQIDEKLTIHLKDEYCGGRGEWISKHLKYQLNLQDMPIGVARRDPHSQERTD
ncbi:MAG: hypothetical protein KDJ39_06595 [Gammaproteobacteria bacterium]|nr:hypothetical protein [Gammaproteobacteria bacterium]